ncbi:hypothetical protein [Modicisalibacter sp. 'Wilcox']|uniref:hypothetical protein n=1 Tax=Modicisalibacter sp. 'Wilcox' TaxID=2679914 RepID=UPI0013D23486|nr:hypothetical protein [Modicisalibacter sp. 'Wilcox']
MKRLLIAGVLMGLLAGCASLASPPPTRAVQVAAAPDAALSAGVAVLAERGFVIQMADAALGRVDAVLASRHGYALTLETQAADGGTRLVLSGRQGGQPVDPARFDDLLAAIRARLETRR